MQKNKILMIDNDDVSCVVASMTLTPAFAITSSDSLANALVLIRNEIPDLILVSIDLLNTGSPTILQLEEVLKKQRIPVVYLTKEVNAPAAHKRLPFKSAAFIIKPFNPETLLDQINNLVATLGTEKSTSILIVDDIPLIRDTVKMLISKLDYALIAGEASNGIEAVESCLSKKPDIILMDVEMPLMDGIEAAKIIRGQDKKVKIIMLTAHDTEKRILGSFAAGADGYILKSSFAETLRAAINTVRLDSVWLDPYIARRILKLLTVSEKQSADQAELFSNQEIATLNKVANCKDDRCLVQPEFVAKLHKLRIA